MPANSRWDLIRRLRVNRQSRVCSDLLVSDDGRSEGWIAVVQVVPDVMHAKPESA